MIGEVVLVAAVASQIYYFKCIAVYFTKQAAYRKNILQCSQPFKKAYFNRINTLQH